MKSKPTFYLDPTEHGDVRELRVCREIGRFSDNFRNDYMLVSIDPPIIGQKYGLGGEDIAQVLLATRHRDYSLYPIQSWPEFVYVIRILDRAILQTKQFSEKQVELISWGVLYQTREQAEETLGDVSRRKGVKS